MKPRTALHLIIGLLVAVALVFIASNIQAGTGSSLGDMILAQRRTPLLWIIDGCAVGIVVGPWLFAVMLDQFQEVMDRQGLQHREQLEDMIERTSGLEQLNDSYADRVERLEAELARQFKDLSDQVATLEASSDARRKAFELEMRRVSDHAQRIFQTQLAANTRHVEAMNMALQFQRSEFRRLRHEFRELQHELAPHLALRIRSHDLTEAPDDRIAIAPNSAALTAGPTEYGAGVYPEEEIEAANDHVGAQAASSNTRLWMLDGAREGAASDFDAYHDHPEISDYPPSHPSEASA